MNKKRTFLFTVATVISTLVLSTFMTGLMSFFITAINTGQLPPNISEWVRAWMVGWAIGTPIVFFAVLFQKEWDCIFQMILEISSCILWIGIYYCCSCGAIAQLGEHLLCTQGQEFESP